MSPEQKDEQQAPPRELIFPEFLADYTLPRFLDALPDTRLQKAARQNNPLKIVLNPEFNEFYQQARVQLYEKLLPTNKVIELNKNRTQITEEEEHGLKMTEQCDFILKNIKKAVYAIQEISLHLKDKAPLQIAVGRNCQEIDLSKLDVVKFATIMALNLWQESCGPDLSQPTSPYILATKIA